MRLPGPHSPEVQFVAQSTQSALCLLAVLVVAGLMSPTFRQKVSRSVLVSGLVFVTVAVPASLFGLEQL
jgi:hypothetical protein